MSDNSGANTEALRKMLAGVWEKNLPLLRERVTELESFAALTKAGTVDSVQREQAIATSHKLVGSFGMFGYTQGTDAARAIEQHLDTDGAVDVAMVETNVGVLRSIVG